MAKIPFKVSARTAKLIGLENFSNEEGAIIELVKNTYDADSKLCLVIFDLDYDKYIGKDDVERKKVNKETSKIYIIDNGAGMTDSIIQNQWMTIGTDDKLYEHLSKGGRVKTGAKGIGRFALNRLGTVSNMLTVSEVTKLGYKWAVNWNHFDISGKTVSEVFADLEEIEQLNLKNELKEKFEGHQEILNIIDSFGFKYGTCIEISKLNDNWEDEQLDKLFGNLEMLLPPREQSDFDIYFHSILNPDNYGKVRTAYYDDFDYKLEAKYHDGDNKSIEIKLTRNELDVDVLENEYSEVFDYKQMSSTPYSLKDFKAKTVVLNKNIDYFVSSETEEELINQIGDFDFTFYFLKNTKSDDKQDGDLKKYPYKNFDSANRKSWLKKFGGVKIFRDDFRIRPYGENGEDWLKLGERQGQSPGGAGQKLGGYKIRPNQIAGTINISRIQNLNFQDKSGREGIQENDAFILFKNILLEIIGVFEKDRNHVMFHLSELHKKRNKEAEAKRKAQEEAEKVKKEKEEKEKQKSQTGDSKEGNAEDTSSDRESTLADGVQILTREIEEKDEEIRLLRNLASVGLIISSFAHEVKSLRSRLIPRTTFLLRELKNYLEEKRFDDVDKDDNPFYMIKLIQEEDTKLKHWLDYSLNTLKRDKRQRNSLYFHDYFERFKSTWSKALEQRSCSLKLDGEIDTSYQFRAFEVDMDSIFNNLLSNSLNALKGVKNKRISISWAKKDEEIIIYFSDSGKGLDKIYHENPEEIFKLLESSKKDKTGNIIGTGLGLYIVKSILEEYNNSTIEVVKIKDGVTFKLTFKTRK